MNIEEIRSEFEYLKTGKIYFNHASVGPLPASTVRRIQEYLIARSAGEINIFMKYLSADRSAKRKLSQLLGCSPDRLAWCGSVGFGMSLLAQGLNWQSGDRIILNDIEFPSNVYPFMNLKNEGVEIDFVKTCNGIAEPEDYERLITPRTKLISVSLVQFLSGYKIDIERLAETCKRRGIILSVDVIQAAGAVEINAEQWGVDFLTGGTQKWLCGFEGLSYFYITEELQNRLKQRFVGWGSVLNAWELLDYELKFPNEARRFQGGTPNSAGVFAADSSFGLFLEVGKNEVEKRVLENTKHLIRRLSEIGYSPLLKEVNDDNLAGIVSFDSDKADSLKNKLAEKNIVVEVRVGKVRVSPHFYNTKEEIDKFVEELKNIDA